MIKQKLTIKFNPVQISGSYYMPLRRKEITLNKNKQYIFTGEISEVE